MPDASPVRTSAPPPPASRGPLLARESILVAVVSNWLWYLLVLASGFVIPRLIHERQGTEILGLWDLGWAMKFYLDWLGVGVGSAVNRYVARYRAVRDWNGLNAHFNSCLVLLTGSAILGVASLAGLWALMPVILTKSDADAVATARWVVLLLGLNGCLKLPGNVFNGLITGYSRFDVLNLIRGTRDIAVLIGDVALLLGGHGIIALAALELAGEILANLAKLVAGRRLCPTLRVSYTLCGRSEMREVLSYGGKTLVRGVAGSGLYQVNGVLVAYFLGPQALAVYSRQRALVMHVLQFIKQYSQVFIPASSKLDARGDTQALRRMLIESSRYALYVMTPMTVLLCLMGGPLVRVWMGPRYEAPLVLAVLAIGHLLSSPQFGTYSVLMGMGRHGRPAVYELGTTAGGLVLSVLLLGPLQWGILGAAVAVALPVALGRGLVLAWYASRLLDLSVWRYLRQSVPGPILASIPLALCLVTARWWFPDDPVRALFSGVGAGGLVTAATYYRWLVMPYLTERARRRRAKGDRVPADTPPPEPAYPGD